MQKAYHDPAIAFTFGAPRFMFAHRFGPSAEFLRWSLKDNGLLENLTMPMFLVNGKVDHLTPIGNLYLALESGPPTGRVARVYPDDGHISARNEREWGPAGWRWLRGQLSA